VADRKKKKIYICLVLFVVFCGILYINIQNKQRKGNLLKKLRDWQVKEGIGVYLIYGREVDGILGECKGHTLLLNKELYIMKGRYSSYRKLFIVEADDGAGKVGLYGINLNGKIIWKYEDIELLGSFWGEISSDGKKFLFFGKDKISKEEKILILNMENGDVFQVPFDGKFPMWCGNEKIVYVATMKSDGLGLVELYDLKTGDVRKLGYGNMVSGAPDGNYVTYRDMDLNFCIIDIRSREKKHLFSGKDILTPLVWSPNSKYLLYVKNVKGIFSELFSNLVRMDFFGMCKMIHRFKTLGMEPKDVMIYCISDGFSVKVGEVYKSMPLDFVFVRDKILYKKVCIGF